MFGFKSKAKAEAEARPALNTFGWQMELKLRANDYKGETGWRDLTKKELLIRLLGEVIELAGAKDDDHCKRECCDVANYAMMIFDNIEERRLKQ